ncbi:hypothetical protein [Halobacterium bonnevillei]|uniref:Uncharacterized protein n=1 Tax=Halobacterium bonnevillei TaxID=2692200 RepID=A0A6B0SQH9_9EURY|nr:hypothetical protein [Halobacterium bonnevillei]MXR19889.1 hypothetical protein [Halobacterium bonnevillei]
MVRHDSSHDTAADSQFRAAAEGAFRLVERYGVALRAAAFFAVALGVGLVLRHAAPNPALKQIVSIGVWFTIMSAICTAILGGVVKVVGGARRRRRTGS